MSILPKMKTEHETHSFDLGPNIQKMLPLIRCKFDWNLLRSISRSYRIINYFFKLSPGQVYGINSQQLSDSFDDGKKTARTLII